MRSLGGKGLLIGVLLACSTATASAQDSTATGDSSRARRSGWIVGGSVGVPGGGKEVAWPIATIGMNATQLVPGRLGADLAIGTAPYLVANGLVVVGARMGVARPIAMSPAVLLIPSGGLSGFAAVGAEGGGVGGVYWGVATVIAPRTTGLRAGITWHRPFGSTSALWLLELGVMRVPFPMH